MLRISGWRGNEGTGASTVSGTLWNDEVPRLSHEGITSNDIRRELLRCFDEMYFVGNGSTCSVWETEGLPDKVVKIPYDPPTWREQVPPGIRHERKRHNEMLRYFPPSWVPLQDSVVLGVRKHEQVLRTRLIVQSKIDEIFEGDYLTPCGTYPEVHVETTDTAITPGPNNADASHAPDFDLDLCEAVTKALLRRNSPVVNSKEFSAVRRSGHMRQLLDSMNQDPRLRLLMVRLLRNHVAPYLQATGRIIDTAGMHNLVFVRSGKKPEWTPKLIDTEMYEGENIMGQLPVIMSNLQTEKEVTLVDIFKLLNGIKTACTFNFLADQAGCERPLHPIPDELIDGFDYRAFYDQFEVTRKRRLAAINASTER